MKPFRVSPSKRWVVSAVAWVGANWEDHRRHRRHRMFREAGGLCRLGRLWKGFVMVDEDTVGRWGIEQGYGDAMRVLWFLIWLGLVVGGVAEEKPDVPEKLVVLTFDDSSKSHFTVVRPILLKHGFGATFYITEGWDFATNKKDYMTWEEIAQLDADGFEIGNHTRDHMAVTVERVGKLEEQLEAIAAKCEARGIARPVTFAWPGNAITEKAFGVLKANGIRMARRGGAPEKPYDKGEGVAYEPGRDHPLLLPSAGDARPDWKMEDFVRAVEKAKDGNVAILQFHGVPDTAHLWVSSERRKFEAYMGYLKENGFRVVALRDLGKWVDVGEEAWPEDAMGVIEERVGKMLKD